MKLYVYDHCPYCVKARMIFGLKDIPFELITLLNDDEETPVSMIGQKLVPILAQEGDEFMPESMEIVAYLDGLEDFGEPIIKPSKKDPRLSLWLKGMRNYHYKLAMPRWVEMGLEEFQTPEAKQYFRDKKEQYIGPFVDQMKEADALIVMATEHLQDLEKQIKGEDSFWGELCEDDIHLFAALRCLTTVKGLQFPEKINRYMNSMSQQTQIPLHWDLAI